ncbi:MAG: zinc-dependent alcohol dehydrogenase family protein [Candidatus Caldatribacteriaceae bacterium]
MRAMVLRRICDLKDCLSPLELVDLPRPSPGEKDILVKVLACGVCRTDLDEIEGRTPPSFFPMVLGHQIVGEVVEKGEKVTQFRLKDRVGIAWINSACGKCSFCQQGKENLCPEFKGTGRDAHGGYAEYTIVKEDFAYPIPSALPSEEVAPLLCAGAVGYRALRLGEVYDGENIGFSGFGASAHLLLRVVQHLFPSSKILVFTRNERERSFARELGAFWAGDFEENPPEKLHCVIDTTPAWKPPLIMLRHLEPGGRLVINAIRKEEKDKEYLLSLHYDRDLWMEKTVKSVANVTRKDVAEFLRLAEQISLRPAVEIFSLENANQALQELKEGKIRGAKVLRI